MSAIRYFQFVIMSVALMLTLSIPLANASNGNSHFYFGVDKSVSWGKTTFNLASASRIGDIADITIHTNSNAAVSYRVGKDLLFEKYYLYVSYIAKATNQCSDNISYSYRLNGTLYSGDITVLRCDAQIQAPTQYITNVNNPTQSVSIKNYAIDDQYYNYPSAHKPVISINGIEATTVELGNAKQGRFTINESGQLAGEYLISVNVNDGQYGDEGFITIRIEDNRPINITQPKRTTLAATQIIRHTDNEPTNALKAVNITNIMGELITGNIAITVSASAGSISSEVAGKRLNPGSSVTFDYTVNEPGVIEVFVKPEREGT